MKKYISTALMLLSLLFIISCKQSAQDVFETINEANLEIEKTYQNAGKEVEQLMAKLTDSAMRNPEKFASAFNHMNEFHTKSERLLTELQDIRELIETQVGETGDYEKWDQDIDALFFNDDTYSANGSRFVKAIQDYKTTSTDQLFFFPAAEKQATMSFNISDVNNHEGKAVDWLTYNFKGFPAIASKSKIALLETDVKKVESMFLKALIEKPQF